MEGWAIEAERHGVGIISNCTITVLPGGENILNPPNSVSTLSCSMQPPRPFRTYFYQRLIGIQALDICHKITKLLEPVCRSSHSQHVKRSIPHTHHSVWI